MRDEESKSEIGGQIKKRRERERDMEKRKGEREGKKDMTI